MLGKIFTVNGMREDALTRAVRVRQDATVAQHRALAAKPAGDDYTFKPGTLGYEWDSVEDNGFQPAGRRRSCPAPRSTMPTGTYVLQNEGDVYGSGTKTHALTLYKYAPSGALVFGAGTSSGRGAWTTSTPSGRHADLRPCGSSRRRSNLFADMGDAATRRLQPA